MRSEVDSVVYGRDIDGSGSGGEVPEWAVHLGAEMISVTARSPDDHSLHPERLKELRPFIPADMTAIAQGGLSSVDDVKRAFELGYHGVLLGSGLLRADDPQQLLSDFIALTDE